MIPTKFTDNKLKGGTQWLCSQQTTKLKGGTQWLCSQQTER